MKLTMGTRGSPLALAQARHAARQLEALHPGLAVEERIIRTTGDIRSQASLPAIGGKGVFTLEIERALLEGTADFAVHSLKDLPPEMPEGLTLAAVPPREDACDCCILRAKFDPFEGTLPFLPHGARVGTSSLRRRAMLLQARPDLQICDVRGNIDTRLRKLETDFHALVLAQAGLNRLGVKPPFSVPLDERAFVPAPGQGALALQAREGDEQTLRLLSALDDFNTRAQIEAERAVVRALNAGCTTPLGARALTHDGVLLLFAVVVSPDGTRRVEAEAMGMLEDAAYVGEECAAQLQDAGAMELLA